MTTNKTVRIQFEISATLAREMESFEAEAEIGSHREFYSNLISLWRWAANRSREGKLIAAIDAETMKFNEITLPSLETIKYKALVDRQLSRADSVSNAEREHSLSRNDDLTAQAT